MDRPSRPEPPAVVTSGVDQTITSSTMIGSVLVPEFGCVEAIPDETYNFMFTSFSSGFSGTVLDHPLGCVNVLVEKSKLPPEGLPALFARLVFDHL